MRCSHHYLDLQDGRYRCIKCSKITHRSPYTNSRNRSRGKKPVLAILLLVPIIAVMILWTADSNTILENFGDEISDASESIDIIMEDIPENISESLNNAADIPETLSESLEGTDTVSQILDDFSSNTDITNLIPDTTPALQLISSSSEPSAESIENARERMLSIINDERQKAGLNAVTMGGNAAAQIHAENMLAGCFSSHWGLDGLKPYMRYSLTGGTQYNAENVSGLSYCVGSNYVKIDPVTKVRDTMDGFMSSPGHRDNILDSHHATVNIGIAADSHNMMVVQHFEYGYADYETLPAINGDIMSFALDIKNLREYRNSYDISVSMSYDPPLRELGRGQVSNTYCYTTGPAVAFFAPPLKDGEYYTEDESVISGIGCLNPYDMSPDISAPTSPEEASRLHDAAKATDVSYSYTVPFVTATQWSVSGDRFEFAADISDVKRGPGVYTVSVFVHDDDDGKDTYIPVTEYSIFHETPSPVQYSQNN